MNQPVLSIVIVSFNTHGMTKDCLESLYANIAGEPYEVILVDNNSHDGSVEMVEKLFPQVVLIKNKDNKGFAAANNQAFAIAKGRFVLLLNSDTLVIKDVIQRSLDYLQSSSEYGAMGCRVLNTDHSVQRTCSGYPTLTRLLFMTLGLDRLSGFFDGYMLRRWQRDDERAVDVITGCYLLLRREVMDGVGYLDERFFFYGEETDWCYQMRKAGWKLRFAPVGEIVHHGGGSVKKLNHKRDVMLTGATVRLHQKNGGYLHAITAFFILLLFNASRALFWNLYALFNASKKPRAAHFNRVVADSASVWPKY